MRLFSLLLASLFFVVSVSATPTRLSGVISNTQSQTVELSYYENMVTFKQVVLPIRLDVLGEFTANLDIDEPLVCKFHFGSESYTLYLKPGDDLYLTVDALYNKSDIQFIGQGADHNNFLIKYKNQFGRNVTSSIRQQISQLSSKEFKALIDGFYNDKLNFYSRNRETYYFESDFEAFIKADIIYWRAYQLLQYRWEHSSNGSDQPLRLSDSYYSFLYEINLNNERALNNVYYTYFLDDFLNYQKEKRNRAGDRLNYKYNNASAYFNGKTLAYIKACDLNKRLKYEPSSETLADAKSFIANTTYNEYARILSDAFLKAEALSPGKKAPDFELVDINGNYARLSDYRGKIILLSFWATWCNPCLHEMYYSKSLLSQFNPGDVEFIYVALENSRESWQNYVRMEGLTGKHLFANGIYETDVALDYGIKSVPHYILIDRDGTIVRNPENKPSQGGIAEDIRELLSGRKLR